MPLTRREAKEIVDWVIQEILKRRFPYVTDGKLDLSKTSVGTLSGTQTTGGQIADGAIWDRHVHPNADIRGTKVRVATTAERGTVELAEHMEAASGIALQADDPRLHDTVPSGSAEHDARYSSTASGYGASLIGVYDGEDEFVSEDVEAALHELLAIINALTFLDLVDTPASYFNKAKQVPTIDESEAGLEFRPVDYYDGGNIDETYSGALAINRNQREADGGSATTDGILDGGQATDIEEIEHLNGLGKEVTISGTGTDHVSIDGQTIVISGQDDPVLPYWDDLRTPITSIQDPPDAQAPPRTLYKGTYVAEFEDQAVLYQTVYWIWQLPHGYKLGSDLYPHIHVVPEDATTGNVYWEFTYCIGKREGQFGAVNTVNAVQAMPGVADYQDFFHLPVISGTLLSGADSISSLILCSLARRSDNVLDTFNGKSVYLLEVDTHYQQDSLGSIQELVKQT
jgi:hypothetical protein